MKYLEISVFDQINDALSCVEATDCRIYGRIEAYSCKAAGEDKKLYKSLETKYNEELESEPPDLVANSPFGPLTHHASRKTLYHLIAALNACFSDYDFSNVKPEHFTKQSNLPLVMNSINTALSNLGEGSSEIVQKLWNALDTEMNLNETDIYCFIPDVDSDPYGEEGSIWSFNYFFYNKKRKRIILITCHAVSLLSTQEEVDTNDDDVDMEIEQRTPSGNWVSFDTLMQNSFKTQNTFRVVD